jgi:hypothetical protein
MVGVVRFARGVISRMRRSDVAPSITVTIAVAVTVVVPVRMGWVGGRRRVGGVRPWSGIRVISLV